MRLWDSQEFGILCWLSIQCLFRKIFLILSFGQIWSHNLEFSKKTVIWYRHILLYVITVLIVFFFKMFAIQFFGQIWSRNLASVVACQIFVYLNDPNSFKLGYSDNKHKDTFYIFFIDRGASVKEWFTVYLPLFRLIIQSYILFIYF